MRGRPQNASTANRHHALWCRQSETSSLIQGGSPIQPLFRLLQILRTPLMARYLHLSGLRLYLTMASRSASYTELKWVRELKKSYLTNLQPDGKSDDSARHRERNSLQISHQAEPLYGSPAEASGITGRLRNIPSASTKVSDNLYPNARALRWQDDREFM